MSKLLRELKGNLTKEERAIARTIGRHAKRKATREQIDLVCDNVGAFASQRSEPVRRLLRRDVWALTTCLAEDFDSWGGPRLLRGTRRMLGGRALNDPEILELELAQLTEVFGASTIRRIGLDAKGLAAIGEEVSAGRPFRIVNASWTLTRAMRTCGCRPAATPELESALALANPFKAVAIAALIAADVLAFSTPATIPLGVASLATAAILIRRGC